MMMRIGRNIFEIRKEITKRMIRDDEEMIVVMQIEVDLEIQTGGPKILEEDVVGRDRSWF